MESDMPMNAGAPPAELNTLLDRLISEVEGNDKPATPPSTAVTAPAPAQAPGEPSLLSGLLANPALLTALPTLAENIGPLLGSLSGGAGTAPTATRPHPIDRHTALLCAVKPYLSPQRREAAETVIRLCRIWDALERSGISLSGLLSGLGGGNSGGTAVSVTAPADGEVT